MQYIRKRMTTSSIIYFLANDARFMQAVHPVKRPMCTNNPKRNYFRFSIEWHIGTRISSTISRIQHELGTVNRDMNQDYLSLKDSMKWFSN